MTSATSLDVANEIRRQLGHKAEVMLGARNFLADEKSLTFKIMGSPLKVTHIKITLDPLDTYRVEFMKIRGFNPVVTVATAACYASELHKVIEEKTALRTSL